MSGPQPLPYAFRAPVPTQTFNRLAIAALTVGLLNLPPVPYFWLLPLIRLLDGDVQVTAWFVARAVLPLLGLLFSFRAGYEIQRSGQRGSAMVVCAWALNLAGFLCCSV